MPPDKSLSSRIKVLRYKQLARSAGMLPVKPFRDRSRVVRYGSQSQIREGIWPDRELPERSRVWRLWQNCRESGMSPVRAKSRRSRPIRRFSRSFQQETPLKVQMKPTEVLAKFQESNRPAELGKEFLTSRRHLTSSSAGIVEKSRVSNSREQSTDLPRWWWRFIIGQSVGAAAIRSLYFSLFPISSKSVHPLFFSRIDRRPHLLCEFSVILLSPPSPRHLDIITLPSLLCS
ncbi:succinyl-CoA ligase [ADP-forming] subunit beta [Striga asiatica]|uniref:Succinyl-CoA ligase [ADP-forming] subunit beta n=1 Tax=Striga asiatica TaxID=4170 RepID=A0A5A7PW17_STRAF|nr:succinyl-CoA ligase [ADP-forming] subunit beta [Striga asiatica]